MQIKTIMVVGAGQMGSGIAQVAAEAKYNVLLCDLEATYLGRAVQSIDRTLSKAVEKGKISAELRTDTLARIATTTELDRAAEAELVIEAVTENVDVKKGIFLQLDKVCAASTILASNTSSIPLTQIASFTKRPDRVVGMHFMNPVPLMSLVAVMFRVPLERANWVPAARW